MDPEDAEEYTQALGQVVGGGWRQIALGERIGVPQALGLSTEEWVNGRLGGYVRLSLPERKGAAAELADEGMSHRAIAGVLGVSRKTVDRDLATVGSSDPPAGAVTPDDQPDPDPVGSNDPPASVTPDGPRYCKYCYGNHEFEIGDDGSLLVCTNCGAGIAQLGEVEDAGSYDAYVERITEEFEARHARPSEPDPETLERLREREQAAQRESELRAATTNLRSVLTYLTSASIKPDALAGQYAEVLGEFQQDDIDFAADTMAAIAELKRSDRG